MIRSADRAVGEFPLPCPAWGGTDPCLSGAALSGSVRGMNLALPGPWLRRGPADP